MPSTEGRGHPGVSGEAYSAFRLYVYSENGTGTLNMIETFAGQLKEFWAWLLQVGLPLAMPAVVLLGLLLAAKFAAATLDRRDGLNLSVPLARTGRSVGKALGLFALVALFATTLGIGMRSVDHYRMVRAAQRFDSRAVVSGTAVNQAMPVVALITSQTSIYHRTIRLAEAREFPNDTGGIDWPAFLESIGYPKSQLIAVRPTYDGQASIRFGQAIEVPRAVVIDKGEIDLALSPVTDSDARANAYRVRLQSQFTWRNQTDKPCATRFAFTLPDNGGTVRDIAVRIGEVRVASADQGGTYVGTTMLTPGQSVTARVEYTTEARGNLRLYPGTGLRAIPDFTVRLNRQVPVYFERGSLMPTTTDGNQVTWTLRDAVTQQIISLAVRAQRSDLEIWWKLGYLAPLALLGFVLLLIAFGELTRPGRELVAATLGQGLGLAVPMLFAERGFPYALLALIGTGVAVATVYRILGRRGAILSAMSAGVGLAGAAANLTALMIWLLLLVATLGFGLPRLRAQALPVGED